MNIEIFKKHLQAVDNPESSFLSHVSREMRTNLDGILGFTQLLASQRQGKLNPKQTRYVSEIYESGRQLHSLINAYADLSRIQAGMLDLNLSKLDINEYILWVLDVLAPQMNSKKMSFTVFWDSPHELIEADGARIKQIFFTLLNKAVDFSLSRERLFLKISFDEEYLKIRLENDPDRMENEGTREGALKLDSNPEDHEFHSPADMNLALVEKLIQMHGGELGLDYDNKGRSYLWFTLRKAISPSREDPNETREVEFKPHQDIPRILLIDDSNNIQNLVSEILKKEHYKVFMADNGKTGLEMAQDCRPDLIFLDINMPVMDGTETIRKLKEIPALKSTPVAALTAEDVEESGQLLLNLGFDQLVVKPFSRSDILNCVLSYFPRAQK